MSLPILRLNDAARAIARSETPPGLPIDCGIVEVGELSVSFNRMAETLRRTIHGLNEEIAVRLQCGLRTVERRLGGIRAIWSKELTDE